jgi:hypothetical protein
MTGPVERVCLSGGRRTASSGPAASDPRLVWELEARLWALLPAEFTGVDLSPVAPIGTCSAVAPVSQHKVITTIRGSEVVSDPTNVLALEAAVRRQRSRVPVVNLASCHRVLLGQPFDEPGLSQHFRLFALFSSARDRGSGATEATMLTAHLGLWARALSDLLPGRGVRVSCTVSGFPPLAERMRDTVLPAGGFTDWTAQLCGDAKERCLISCVATERLAALRSSEGQAL